MNVLFCQELNEIWIQATPEELLELAQNLKNNKKVDRNLLGGREKTHNLLSVEDAYGRPIEGMRCKIFYIG
ncbi:MAG TPA: hypothetical protein V6C65_04585 [Allocoleopsis sp.]